jgi:hypothetical protein
MLKCESFSFSLLLSLDVDRKCSYYKALTFYLQEQPSLLTDLLSVMISRIDHTRVVRMFKQLDHIPLIRAYLIAVQEVSYFSLSPYLQFSAFTFRS